MTCLARRIEIVRRRTISREVAHGPKRPAASPRVLTRRMLGSVGEDIGKPTFRPLCLACRPLTGALKPDKLSF
jgi:hypothetical protein